MLVRAKSRSLAEFWLLMEVSNGFTALFGFRNRHSVLTVVILPFIGMWQICVSVKLGRSQVLLLFCCALYSSPSPRLKWVLSLAGQFPIFELGAAQVACEIDTGWLVLGLLYFLRVTSLEPEVPLNNKPVAFIHTPCILKSLTKDGLLDNLKLGPHLKGQTLLNNVSQKLCLLF